MKFSIITIGLNACDEMRKTIASVNAQTFADCEHVIVDGGSTDGSKEMFLEESLRLGAWVSEKDGGISAAFNRGTRLAKGEWVCYLNAGDIFAANDVLEKAAEGIDADGTAEAVFYGDFILEGADSRSLATACAQPSLFAWTNPINHQSVFLPRHLAAQFPYNEALQLAMDYDLWLRLLPRVAFRKLNLTVAVFRTDGRSSSPKWAVHNLVIRRIFWHISRSERLDLSKLTLIYVRGLLLYSEFQLRRIVGRKFILSLKKIGFRRHRTQTMKQLPVGSDA